MRKLQLVKHLFLVGSVFVSYSVLYAQSDTARVRTLDEVIVSASRQEERILETPRTVTVIDRAKIENSVYNSVGDLLAKQQGIYLVGSNQTPGTNQSAFLRGANSNQIAVMIDGVRITDPSTPNNVIDLSELSLTNVDRIEILSGSHSTQFGGAAIGGVINIITRKNGAKGVHAFVGLQSGTFGHGSSSFIPQVELTYSAGNGFYANGSLFYQSVAGLNASIDTVKNGRTGRTPEKDGFRKTDGYLKAGFLKNGWDVFASYKNVDQRSEIDNGAYQDDDNNYVSFRRKLFNYGIARQISDRWKLSFNGSWTDSRRQAENDSSRVDATTFDGSYSNAVYHGKLLTNELQGTYQNKGLRVLVGAGLFAESMSFNTYFYSSAFGGFESTTNYDTIKTNTTTKYAFGQVRLASSNEKLAVTVGGRLSSHSLFGSHGMWEVNPSLQLSKTSLLYASFSTGFNAPSLYQLYDPTNGGFTTRGNRGLKPETSLSIELGLKKQFTSGSYLTASIFHTEVQKAIEYVYLWDKNTPISGLSFLDYFGDTYINIVKQEASGIELAGSAVLTEKISLSGNATFLEGKATFSPNDIDQAKTGGNHVQVYSNGAFINQDVTVNNLVRRPKVTGFAELRYRPIEKVTLTANYRLAGRRTDVAYDYTLGPFGALNSSYVSTYQLIDAGVRWQIEKHLSVTLKMENIFNVNYQEIYGYNTRGRSAYIRLNFKW